MHLTVIEAGLLGVLITAVAGRLGQGAARTRDHLTRIWERETNIYESVLIEASSWSDLRAEGARYLRYRLTADQDLLVTPETDIDYLKRRRVWAQLEMFGRPEVKSAFDSYGEAHKEWVIAYAALRSAYRENQDADDGLIPPHQIYDQAEMDRRREMASKAKEAADSDDLRLTTAIRQAVQQIPKPRVRIWPWPMRMPRLASSRYRDSLEQSTGTG